MSGIDKILRPAGAGAAMRAAEVLPRLLTSRGRSHRAAQLLGAVELGTVVMLLVAAEGMGPSLTPQIVAIGPLCVAAIFGGFHWFVRRLASRDAAADCGCFGPASTPPGPAHQRFTTVAIVVALATAVVCVLSATTPSITLVTSPGLGASILYATVIVVAALVFLLGPSLLADLRPPPGGHPASGSTAREFAITGTLSR
ncbi:MAG: hypothetical protein R2706_15780 [Acidimicrobiales bacterium]